MNAYPISYEMAYQEKHSRLSTFFRMILAIPAAVFLVLYSIVAGIAVLIAFVVLVFTARYPAGLYDFVAGWVRLAGRLSAYEYLLTDLYPPFSGGQAHDYPCQITVGPPQEKYSRLKVFFRIIVGIPTLIMNWLFTMWAGLMAFAAWVVIVITGKLPYGLYEQQVLAERYRTRAGAYFVYLTDLQPPISDKSAADVQQPPASAPPPPPAAPPPAAPAQ